MNNAQFIAHCSLFIAHRMEQWESNAKHIQPRGWASAKCYTFGAASVGAAGAGAGVETGSNFSWAPS
jgi:hypothetical protein